MCTNQYVVYFQSALLKFKFFNFIYYSVCVHTCGCLRVWSPGVNFQELVLSCVGLGQKSGHQVFAANTL